MAKELWQSCEHRDIWVTATHIPGVKNVEADEESGVFKETVEWTLPLGTYQLLVEAWGPFQWDLFASRLNAKCRNYISWNPDPGASVINVFAHNLNRLNNWHAFPPFRLLGRVLAKAWQEEYTSAGRTLLASATLVRHAGSSVALLNSATGELWQT